MRKLIRDRRWAYAYLVWNAVFALLDLTLFIVQLNPWSLFWMLLQSAFLALSIYWIRLCNMRIFLEKELHSEY